MSLTLRHYTPTDFELVSEFLSANYLPGNQDGNWLQPAWAYMHSHPNLDESSLDRIGIWENEGELVGVAHYESSLGEAIFQIHPDFNHLKPAMLKYAEEHLYTETEDGDRHIRTSVKDFDPEFEALVQSRGYQIAEGIIGQMSSLTIPRQFPAIDLPPGFRIKSLAEDNDLRKVHRVLWRGFDHPGEPPEEGIKDRIKMQSSPYFRLELTIVVEESGGNFVSFCGTWYEPFNKYAYVEPVATDLDYRRLGLGKAAVWEGIRRCGDLGATVAYVGSGLDFYKAIGFKKVYNSWCWEKRF